MTQIAQIYFFIACPIIFVILSVAKNLSTSAVGANQCVLPRMENDSQLGRHKVCPTVDVHRSFDFSQDNRYSMIH